MAKGMIQLLELTLIFMQDQIQVSMFSICELETIAKLLLGPIMWEKIEWTDAQNYSSLFFLFGAVQKSRQHFLGGKGVKNWGKSDDR